MTKVLVTGATGFLGNHIINKLLLSNCEIIASSIEDEQIAKSYDWFDKVRYIQADINSTNVDFNSLFAYPETLIHLAWEGLPNYNEFYHIENNLKNSFRFINSMLVGGVKNLAVSGTCFEYGMQEGCLSEDMKTEPTNPYGLSKDILRQYIEDLKNRNEFNLVWTRIFYLYGVGQNPKSLLGQLNTAVSLGQTVFNMSEGDQIRDFINVEMAAEIIVKLALSNNDYGIVNICSGKPETVVDFVSNYMEINSIVMELNLGYYPYSEFEPKNFWGDRTKLDSILLKLG